MTNMTTRAALTYAISEMTALMEHYDSTQTNFNGEVMDYNPAEVVAKLNAVIAQMDAKNAKSAQYAKERKERKNAAYNEEYNKVVEAFDRVGEPTTLTDLIRGDSELHANMTTQKLVQIIKHGDGTIVKAKVKSKMLYGRREWFGADAKIEGEE